MILETINRSHHAEYGGLLANEILKKSDMDIKDRITIVSAISNHDESTGGTVDVVSAALIIADKTDVRRDRVRSEKGKAAFDIHDRVNYAVTEHKLKVNIEKRFHLIFRLILRYVQCMSILRYFLGE